MLKICYKANFDIFCFPSLIDTFIMDLFMNFLFMRINLLNQICLYDYVYYTIR